MPFFPLQPAPDRRPDVEVGAPGGGRVADPRPSRARSQGPPWTEMSAAQPLAGGHASIQIITGAIPMFSSWSSYGGWPGCPK